MNDSDHKQLETPIHVLHVFGRMNRGGAELRTLDVFRHLSPSEVHMDFCTLSGLPGDLDAEIALMGGNVHPCKLGIGFGRRFRRLLRELKPDVVHSHVHYSSGYLLHLANKEHVPIRIAHFRSTSDGNRRTMRRRVQNMVLRRMIDANATSILAVNHAAMELAWLQYMPGDTRCMVVYNGFDIVPYEHIVSSENVRSELEVPPDKKIIINVSKFIPEKNHMKMIEVLYRLRMSAIEPILVLVGRGDNALQTEVMNRARELGVADQIRVLGVRLDVPRLMAAADVLLFPSLREGLPGVVLEACILGIPVVASTLPGTVEIAERFHTVKCVDVNASDEMWADCIESAMATDIRMTDAINSFKSSEFTVHSASQKLMRVWRGDRVVHA